MSTSNIQFDLNSNTNPVPPTLSKFHYIGMVARSWHCNSDPHRVMNYSVTAEGDVRQESHTDLAAADVIPPYKGEHKSRMQEWSFLRTSKATNSSKQAQEKAILPDSAPSTPVDIEGINKLAARKKVANRERLETAFANLKAKVAGADHEFYGVVGYKFVLGKVSNRMYDAGECATTEHDVTNNILFELSQNIDKVKSVYAYLCNAAWKQGGKAFTENIDDRKTHEPLIVEVEDERGKPDNVDNPGIRGNIEYKRGGKVVFQESRPQFLRELPEFIQGKDLQICQYRREGFSYAKIAEILCMTVPSVKLRIARMKKEIAEMKTQEAR